ncbi:ABC transporter ATP-binding protein [Thermus thermophilus]|uniref:ABC transporter ATP-binding protein n=1 Tax=Thermus thermophilus TaxID=274 RepID=UPI001165C756|nr:ABC transporter ATP-binding protein [Thermus thermophilus]BBL82554.1 sugar ABC transporter ATP-binding protein [Thermus thermophilus]BBL84854.1 sugar ABC transporter ATP-binding protein [Thermus thermophilus]BCZ94766.1 sugar ABC transporter ATP-binding protein [Thermus thermophilus]
MLRLENITKRFGPVVANDRISLEVRAGEVLALLGENGAGKTTLVSLLYGLYAPDEGRILLEGRPVQIPSPKAAQALGIALVPQHPELIEAHTVAENLALGLDLPFLLPRRALVRRLKALLAGHPLGVDLEAPVHLLSAGEKQRVEILRALLAKPKVLILDEPTSVLTPQEAEGLFQEIARYKAMGLAVIFISHKLDEVLRVADRIAVLRGGRKVGEVPREKADRDLLVRLMVGREVEPPRLGFPPGKRPLLEVRDLFVPRRGVPVQGVSFVLWEGEILGVAGVAGSGQKELVEALAGLRPYRGEVRFLGAPLPRDPARLHALGVAHIPEDRAMGVVGTMSVAENLALRRYARFARRGFLSRRAMEEKASELIRRFGIRAPSPRTPVRFLSGGNVQKVILARELGEGARVVLAMHPTYGVDVGAAEEVHRLLLDLAKGGAAVLLVSEDLDEILALSHRVAALYQGRMVGPLPREEVGLERLGAMMTGGRA